MVEVATVIVKVVEAEPADQLASSRSETGVEVPMPTLTLRNETMLSSPVLVPLELAENNNSRSVELL